MSVEILSTSAKLYEKSHLKRLATGEWPWRSLNVTGIAAFGLTTHHLLLVVCSNNDFILHRFHDITTFTVYVISCDLEKSFGFKTTPEITKHVHSNPGVNNTVNNAIFSEIWKLKRFQTANLTFKVT